MSSYDIARENYLLLVGWNRPLDTFFATIEKSDGCYMEEPDIVIGTILENIETLMASSKR